MIIMIFDIPICFQKVFPSSLNTRYIRNRDNQTFFSSNKTTIQYIKKVSYAYAHIQKTEPIDKLNCNCEKYFSCVKTLTVHFTHKLRHLDPKLRQSIRHSSIRIVMKGNFLDIGRLASALVSKPSILISVSPLPEIGRAMSHLTKELITVSFRRREVFCHACACPTHYPTQIKSVYVFTFVAILSTSNGLCTVHVLATRK